MGIYTSSKGEQKDTADMPYTYLCNALNKAIANGDQANIDVLQDEKEKRDRENQDMSTSANM